MEEREDLWITHIMRKKREQEMVDDQECEIMEIQEYSEDGSIEEIEDETIREIAKMDVNDI